MRRFRDILRRAETVCALWIALCFSLTSCAYLSWVYRLMDFVDPARVDLYALVLGYAFQAVGLAAFAALCRTRAAMNRRTFCACVLAFCGVALPALVGDSLAVTLIFGMLMNLMCGVVAGFYLCRLAGVPDATGRGRVFGFAYGLSTLFIFLLSLPKDRFLLRSQAAWVAPALLTAAAVGAAFLPHDGTNGDEARDERRADGPVPGRTLLLAVAAVLLSSLVKNLGFGFPSADIAAGMNLEASRLLYALGLMLAGVIADRDRKYGAISTLVALVLPFVMLSVSGEGLPAMLCWGFDYLLYGFFSVFRVVLFTDLADRDKRLPLAALGLMAGRAGDALGTALYRLLAFNRVALIGLALALFAAALVLILRLCRRLYMPEEKREISESEMFESFAIQCGLSPREREVLRLVLAEQTVSQMAETLFVAESTVRYHVHHLLQKSGCKSRQELVRQYNLKRYPRIALEKQA